MTLRRLLLESVTYFWRANLAVVLGALVGASVLTGALLVGDSMRGTLRDMTLERLGDIDHVVVVGQFFQQDLADRLRSALAPDAPPITSAILLQGSVGTPDKRLRVSQVQVVGVTPEFWSLFPGSQAPAAGQSVMNQQLAEQLGVQPPANGESLSSPLPVIFYAFGEDDVPRDAALGRRNEPPKPIAISVQRFISNSGVGRFSLQLSQAIPPTLYVPIEELARDLNAPGRANALFIGQGSEWTHAAVEDVLGRVVSLEDLGIELIPAKDWISIETREKVIADEIANAILARIRKEGWKRQRVLAYLANSMTALSPGGETIGREIPYSVVAAVDFASDPPFGPMETEAAGKLESLEPGQIVVNQWTADQWGMEGERTLVRMTYYVVESDGSLREEAHDFGLASVLAMRGVALDQKFVPTYKGITDATTLNDWDAPFPLERKIEDADEQYWNDYKTAPKAFVRLDDGQSLWKSRFGKLTSIRVAIPDGQTADRFLPVLASSIRESLPMDRLGFAAIPIREQNLGASTGSTDFGMLFLSMSFFLIVSAALLVALLFRLNTELRASSIGVLLAVGWPPRQVRGLLLTEGVVLAAIGSMLGLLGGAVYARWILELLTTSWRSAVGTSFLDYHSTPLTFLIGWTSSVLVAAIAIWWATARIGRTSVPRLLSAGSTFGDQHGASNGNLSRIIGVAGIAIGFGLMAAGATGWLLELAAFFGGGGALLVGSIGMLASALSRRTEPDPSSLLRGGATTVIARLAARNTARYRTRSLVTVSLMALAVFVIVAVGCMRRASPPGSPNRNSGNGGFSLLATASSPLPRDLNSKSGRAAMNVSRATEERLASAEFFGFRVRPGDDASCLNVYQPSDPTILGALEAFVARGGFAFGSTLAEAPNEHDNPWTLLDEDLGPGVIPAIGDAATLQWILKVPVGQELTIKDESGLPVRLKIVGELTNSIFQGQLIISEANFLKMFPSGFGRSLFVFATPEGESAELAKGLGEDLSEFGFEARSTGDVIASYLAVQSTYMAAFELLGGLGLLLGTLGLAAVLARNVFERRGEWAVLQALGFGRGWIASLILFETAIVVALGIVLGTVCAVVAVAPQFRDIDPSKVLPLVALLTGVGLLGMVSGVLAVWLVGRTPVLQSLRVERA